MNFNSVRAVYQNIPISHSLSLSQFTEISSALTIAWKTSAYFLLRLELNIYVSVAFCLQDSKPFDYKIVIIERNVMRK